MSPWHSLTQHHVLGHPADRENKPSKALPGDGLPSSLLTLCFFAELQAWTLTSQATLGAFLAVSPNSTLYCGDT